MLHDDEKRDGMETKFSIEVFVYGKKYVFG